MARLTFLILLAAAFAGVCSAIPAEHGPILALDGCGQNWCWESCGQETDPVHIHTIKISPDPPVKGQDLTVNVKGTANVAVEEGAVADVVVKVGAIRILQQEFDVCEEARNANVSLKCPVDEGEHEVTHTVALPNEVPNAKFSVNIQGYTVDDEDLMCINLWIDFRKKSPFMGLGW